MGANIVKLPFLGLVTLYKSNPVYIIQTQKEKPLCCTFFVTCAYDLFTQLF